MQITEVRVKTMRVADEEKLKGFADITFEGFFVIHGIRILKNENGYFISMPAKKMPNGEYKDIVHPITSDYRSYLTDMVVAAYEEQMLKECAIESAVAIQTTAEYRA